MPDQDIIETLYTATIQHGPQSDRIYLMDIGKADTRRLIDEMLEIARDNRYGKLFAKVPATDVPAFIEAGFEVEATVKRMYHGVIDGVFLGLFVDENRKEESCPEHCDAVLQTALKKTVEPILPAEGSVRICTPEDAHAMALVYRSVFDSYPFPIDDPAFITQSMQEGTLYAAVERDGEIAALASAECNVSEHAWYAEMTDFATRHAYRGNGYAVQLLAFLEQKARDRGILTLYTIARAASYGMNCTFAKCGYTFGGRLKNNTQISGTIESMNVWYRN